MKCTPDTRLYRTSEVLKELRHQKLKTVDALHQYLQRHGVLKRLSNRWMISREYAGLDYTRHIFRKRWHLYWTPRGIEFLRDMLNGQNRLETRRT